MTNQILGRPTALWAEQLLPRFTDVALGTRELRRHRERAVDGLSGEVVEIGFGSGLNVALYPPSVQRVYAVEPSAVARRLAAKRIALSTVPVDFIGLDGQHLPLAAMSADMALSTFSLCTIPDVAMALQELYRVLRPGGRFHFLEHGLSKQASIARWQHRLNGFQQRVAGGCHLDRRIDALVTEAGFLIQELDTDQAGGPALLRPWDYLYCGVAAKPAVAPG